jgi:hypothetical protein
VESKRPLRDGRIDRMAAVPRPFFSTTPVHHSSDWPGSRRLRLPRRAGFDPFSPSVGSWRVEALHRVASEPPQRPLRVCTAQANSRPKWRGEPKEPSQAGQPGPARRRPPVLPRVALARRWGSQGRFPISAGGAARRQRPPDRVGDRTERLRVRLLLLLAPGELERPGALSGRARTGLRSWAYRTH